MTAATLVVYRGPDDAQNPSTRFEIDGVEFRKDRPVEVKNPELAAELLAGKGRVRGYVFEDATEKNADAGKASGTTSSRAR